MFFRFLCASVLLSLMISPSAADNPESAIVVVNSESASSKLIANHYVFDRRIPAENVIYLKDIPDAEMIGLAVFRNRILIPLLKEIEKRGLSNHIDYIIYSAGFPTIINATADRKKLLSMGNPDSPFAANSQLFRPFISLTSATYFLRQIVTGNPTYLSLNANSYGRKEARNLLTLPFVGEDAESYERALSKARTGKFDEAIESLEKLAEKHPLQLAVVYWLARTHAWKGNVADALTWLKRSVALGWCYRDFTMADSAFETVAEDEEIKAFIASIPNMPFRYGPSYSFRSIYNWGPNGMINSTPDQGNQFMLSTMLAVTRNQGNSEQEALKYLKRSIAADGTQPQGTFYFSRTRDVRTRTRAEGIQHAVEELQLLGFPAEVVSTPLPNNRPDVVGACIGTANFDWAESRSTILAGAICENLTSFGGRLLPGTKQTKLTEFLRFGAAGSSGTVIEPTAIQAKFPRPRIHTHYVRGCTLAESFYQSVEGPFQLLIVGDALCRPWARAPQLNVSGSLESGMPVSGEIKIRLDGDESPVPIRATDIYLDGRLLRRIAQTGPGPFRVDSRTMPDGYHEFRFVAVSGSSVSNSSSTIVPFVVDNQGRQVQLDVGQNVVDINDTIRLTASAPGADSIALVHNGRMLATEEGEQAEFRIAAYEPGRGTVFLEAVASFADQASRSRPVRLEIAGPIATTIPVLQTPPRPNRQEQDQ